MWAAYCNSLPGKYDLLEFNAASKSVQKTFKLKLSSTYSNTQEKYMKQLLFANWIYIFNGVSLNNFVLFYNIEKVMLW